MAAARRAVRASPTFFFDLDDQLPAERSADGTPSVHDFLAYDLFDVLDVIADDFDELPPFRPGRDDVRVLVTTGVLISHVAVVGWLVSDDTILLIGLHLERGPR